MNTITAPFTAGQVLRLRRWQASDWVHPYTCGNPDHDEVTKLEPTIHGLRCYCGTVQTWAWDYEVPRDLFAHWDTGTDKTAGEGTHR